MDNWKVVITSTFPSEAHMIEGYLNSYGIETSLLDEFTVQVNTAYSNAVGGIKILVLDSDYDQSIKLLKTGGYINDPDTQDNSEQQVSFVEYSTDNKICPFCKSDNITVKKKPNSVSAILSVFISFLYFAAIAPIYKYTFICFDCGKEWKFKKP